MTPTEKFKEVVIGSVSDLLRDLTSSYSQNELIWYRGHARRWWSLMPSLARKAENLTAELALMEEFKRDAIPLLARADLTGGPMTEWDWVFVMQHYQVPTRLMDWSESPLIGLFFALDDAAVKDPPDAACLWALQPMVMNKAARIQTNHPWQVPVCGEQHVDLDKYLPSKLQDGMMEMAPLAVAATRRFDRIRAQQGTFTLVHRNPKPLEEVVQQALTKYVIPEEAKDSIRHELDRLGFHAATMYPDLEHLGRRIAGRLK